MNGWLIGYLFCAGLMFAWLAFPPFKRDQESQKKALDAALEKYGRGPMRYVHLLYILVVLAILWPIVLVSALFDVGGDMEFYE